MGLVRLQMKMVCLMAPITLFFFAETSVLGVVANLLIVPRGVDHGAAGAIRCHHISVFSSGR